MSNTESALQKRTICVTVDNFTLVNNMLFVTVPHVVVRYHNKMDIMNINEWLGSVGTMNELFCMSSKRLFGSGEVAYNNAQSTMDCTAPSEVQKELEVRQGIPTVAHLE